MKNGIVKAAVIGGIKAMLPTVFKRCVRFLISYPGFRITLARNYQYDLRRYLRWSSASGAPLERTQLLSWINADYHKLEKALALRDPRPGFGVHVVQRLLINVDSFLARFGVDEIVLIAINSLYAYLEFNEKNGVANPELRSQVDSFAARCPDSCLATAGGGTLEIDRESILQRAQIDLTDFFESRYSIRQFAPISVPRGLIEQAVSLARKTPTVCNRQSPKVYVFDQTGLREEVVSCQKGNEGFGSQIQVAFVVTVDVKTFFSFDLVCH